jgi:chromosome partitioning protein
MPLVIGCISQKGGVGKSTLARMLAAVYAGARWDTKIADLNTKQGTSANWVRDRISCGIAPEIAGECFSSVTRALKSTAALDLVIFDGAPDSHGSTLDIARVADILVIPTGVTRDDLVPQINLARELVDKGVGADDLVFVLNKTLDSESTVLAAKGWIRAAGFTVADNHLRYMTSYQNAQNQGRAVTETAVKNLNEEADRLAQELVDLIQARLKETA